MKLTGQDLPEGYELHQPMTGGKAGKGHNVTTTIQVRKHGSIVYQRRYKVGDKQCRDKILHELRLLIFKSAGRSEL